MKYKVIDKKGVLVDGKIIKEGSILPAGPISAAIRAMLHFKQIVKVKEDPAKAEAEAKESPKAQNQSANPQKNQQK